MPTGPYRHRTVWLREVCARLLATILLGFALRVLQLLLLLLLRVRPGLSDAALT